MQSFNAQQAQSLIVKLYMCLDLYYFFFRILIIEYSIGKNIGNIANDVIRILRSIERAE